MNKFLLLILFLIIIFVLFNCVSRFDGDISKKLYNGDSWSNYRLGDVYLIDKRNRIYNENYSDNILYHKNKYIGSIANEYINANTFRGKNETLLRKIIESRTKDKRNYPDTLFLHIRVGDVICVKDDAWINQVNGPRYYSKVGDTVWWDAVIKYIKKYNIKKVVILSGSHMNKCLIESAKYIEDRKNFLTKHGLHVSYRLGQSPDEDLIMCYYVKHFITTGGGYGNMIKEIKIK